MLNSVLKMGIVEYDLKLLTYLIYRQRAKTRR